MRAWRGLVLLPIVLCVTGCELGIRPVNSAAPTATPYPCDLGASLFGGGYGTAISPYKVCTRAHLAAITGSHLTEYFIQLTDIDLGGASGGNFTPIGNTGGAGFTGEYNGNSKTISNLYYNGTNTNRGIGLFGFVDTGGVVKNVILTGVSITTTDTNVGALAANLTSATIQNCSASGSISGDQDIGGLVGVSNTATITSSHASVSVTATSPRSGGLVANLQDSTITSSYATGNVTCDGDAGGLVGTATDGTGFNSDIQSSYATGNVTCAGGNTSAGGLVGIISAIDIVDSYATGNVSSTQNDVGGLVGFGDNVSLILRSYASGTVSGGAAEVGGLVGGSTGITIQKSYATGAVTGVTTSIGGLIGHYRGDSIEDSYARGSATGFDEVGGLAGYAAAPLTNSYSTGLVTGTGAGIQIGGLVGLDGGAITNNCYWDTVTSGQAASPVGIGLTTAQMKAFANFVGWDFATIWNGAGFGGSAAIYPYLR